ncbi:MAG: C25 family cysteine peptidase, partial [Bacteroidota bacterium]|nr:C25 family cysteine peptidase [Bacteroidota bacterium]
NRYLLLLGKGIVPSEPVLGAPRYTYYRNAGELGLDLVPTSSRSVSDNLLTADYANNNWVAKLHTGRLTATTPRQVMNYLNKMRTYDSLGPAPWRKNVLHLVGGKVTPIPDAPFFLATLNTVKTRIERPLWGGKVVKTELKSSDLPVSVNIAAELNAGLSVIDYFGHASSNRLTLDFGAPSTEPTYANTGRYPVLILNGCAANATFTAGYTIVEDFLFADQKGAIGSLAESGFGFPLELASELDSLHKLLFNDPNWYGKPVTVVHDELVRRLQSTGFFQGSSGIEQLLTRNWQGDPTIAIYSPPLPDFIASNNTLAVVPVPNQGPVKADSPNLVVNVGVSNPGKVTYEPLRIRVVQRRSGFANDTTIFPVRQSWKPDTTYALTVRNAFKDMGGTTTFIVKLDYDNRIAESNENNNEAQIDFAFLTGGVAVVNPTEFAIVATATPTLTIQSNNPNEVSRGYEFELSPDPAFPVNSVRATVTGSVLAEWQPVLPTVSGRDSVVYYWRARFQTPAAGEDNSWVTSSFRVIPGSPGGWSQSHYGQFKRDTRLGVDVGVPSGVWTFTRTADPLVLRTIGGGLPRSAAQFATLAGGGIYLQSQDLPVNYYCGTGSPNLLLGVYDSLTLRPVPMPAKYQKCGQAPNSFYFFSTTGADTLDNLNYSVARQQRLDSFLRAVPNGAYVAAVSMNRLRYSLLPAYLKNRLQSLLGSQLITTLADGEPLALVGQKLTATTGRLISEVGPDRSSGTAAYNQRIELRTALTRPGAHGRILSTRIGPAQEWLNLYNEIRIRTAGGHDTLRVVGIGNNGAETVVLPRVTAASQPLGTAAPAATYPYLRLELSVSDTITRVPPQLKQWLITSRGLPEGVVLRDAVPASTYAAATLLAQATSANLKGIVSFPVKFKNVSSETFNGPLLTRVLVRRPGSSVLRTFPDISTPAPAPGATATINVSIDLKGLYGPMAIEVVVNPQLQNPQLQPEQNYTNNQLILPEFNVINNNVPPTLDVAIDGRYILNGELVSSQPVIVVQLSDEDPLRHITKRDAFTLTLQRPGQANPVLVPLNGADILFAVDSTKGSQARLTFEPAKNGPLPDGVYTLRAQGRDPNAAAAAAQEVTLKFEVVNAATITNVYPYPNPVISKARFVFTVTGHELPRNMKIQIMSLTGRVVREIFMNELGPLHLGNNITDYAWDGTDGYGDRLANGTYLYRVAYDDNVGFSHRDTAGDKAFKNDWGKLVLMR